MRQYAEYSKTKADWLPDIPTHWNEQRIKTLFSLHDERNYLPLSEVNLISLYAKVGVIQHSDIEHTTGNRASNADGYKIVNKDDIIVNILLCWMGAIGRSDYNGVTSPAYDVYSPKKGVNSQYYHYLFRLPSFSQQCYRAGKGIMAMRWRTYSPQFCNIVVPVPPRLEQDQIVRFLDWKVSEINRLVNIKEKEVSELQEYQKCIINQAITKGINDSVKCKESGIDWIGSVPENWNIVKLKRVSKERKEKQIYIPCITDKYIGLENIKSNSEQLITTNSEYDKSIQSFCHKGDLLFGKLRPYLSKVIVAPYDSCCTNELLVLYSFAGNIHFLRYVMVSNSFIQIVDSSTYGTKMPRANTDYIMNMFVPFPPIEEQNLIVKYLNKRIGEIDSVVDKVIKQISLLQEYKTRMISDVVTGQIDVRDIVVPEYEYVKENSDVELDSADESEEPVDKEVS